ncbi:hypothetical protein U8527_15450 [Kordia algicida OT-1]|uniref:Haemagluttinin domain protein n=1 Tax=Kordia algicida OT-1 TaxID=391587 RepID=A9E803_9FLAO|nr:Haemagluttinin domain protein [Kordia algicida]EDP94951.1 Haemagluttinin domain protein [Kordia algicida OT-1]
MKARFSLLLLMLFYSINSFSQTRGINYKAVIADTNGLPMANQSVTIQFTIFEGNMATNIVYQETHTTTTNANGIVIVNIGEGVNVSGDFQMINWGFDTHFVKTEIDSGSGFVDFGTTEFKTVPYALHAETVSATGDVSPFSEATPNRISATNTNADFVVGSTSTEDENNVNLDGRMFFDKSKVAFRVGSVDGTQWNDSNRGLYSFAAGRNTRANGVGTTAFGKDTQAITSYSTALGDGTIAGGYASLVVGVGTKSNNSSQFVNGTYNVEDNSASLIVGNGTSDTERQNAFVVKSNGSIIAGSNQFENDFSTNNDDKRFFFDKSKGALRAGSTNGGTFNYSYWNDANIGENSIAFGLNTVATGYNAVALGEQTTASGRGAIAVGRHNFDDPDAIFMVGNGSPGPFNSSLSSTAFKVMIDGTVNIDDLSGTGTRNVKVTADGDLVASITNTKNYSIGPYDFEASFSDAQIRRNFTFVYLSDNVAERAITAPVHLPDGVTITGYTANYLDNSTSTNLQFSLYRISATNGSSVVSIGLFNSSGNMSSNRSDAVTGLSETIDNENFMYIVRVIPINGQNWDVPNTNVRSIQIQYQEN